MNIGNKGATHVAGITLTPLSIPASMAGCKSNR